MGITARAMEQQDCVISVAGCILVRLAQSEIVELSSGIDSPLPK